MKIQMQRQSQDHDFHLSRIVSESQVYKARILELERELSNLKPKLEATEQDRQRLRGRLLTTASQLESAVEEARGKDKERRNIIKAYKQKLQKLEEVSCKHVKMLLLQDLSIRCTQAMTVF
jgi:hypothetical protein